MDMITGVPGFTGNVTSRIPDRAPVRVDRVSARALRLAGLGMRDTAATFIIGGTQPTAPTTTEPRSLREEFFNGNDGYPHED